MKSIQQVRFDFLNPIPSFYYVLLCWILKLGGLGLLMIGGVFCRNEGKNRTVIAFGDVARSFILLYSQTSLLHLPDVGSLALLAGRPIVLLGFCGTALWVQQGVGLISLISCATSYTFPIC